MDQEFEEREQTRLSIKITEFEVNLLSIQREWKRQIKKSNNHEKKEENNIPVATF